MQRNAAALALMIVTALATGACSDSRSAQSAGRPLADVPANPGDGADHAADGGSGSAALARIGGEDLKYRATEDTVALRGGRIVGRIGTKKDVSGDSVITPTHDLDVCKPFTDSRLPSAQRGVGNAVVWLLGVTKGPAQDASRRATLLLERCQLQPRVQRMATGGTVLVTSGDAMMSSLRFTSIGGGTQRATVSLNDAGQVVPNSDVATTAGLVEVRDDRHPWVRAYIAVSSHPFVAITTPDGAFRFAGVPPGAYTLVVWQEQLGVQSRAVRVTTGVETRVTVDY